MLRARSKRQSLRNRCGVVLRYRRNPAWRCRVLTPSAIAISAISDRLGRLRLDDLAGALNQGGAEIETI